jgi:ER lumen protein retaining receptor
MSTIVVGGSLLALLITDQHEDSTIRLFNIDVMETAWTYSILVEAVAVLPQLFLLWRLGFEAIDRGMLIYLALLGSYRGLYIANWIYRYDYEDYYDPISVYSGCLQTGIFVVAGLAYVVMVLKKR